MTFVENFFDQVATEEVTRRKEVLDQSNDYLQVFHPVDYYCA